MLKSHHWKQHTLQELALKRCLHFTAGLGRRTEEQLCLLCAGHKVGFVHLRPLALRNLCRVSSALRERAEHRTPRAPPQPVLLHAIIPEQPAACTANDHLNKHGIYKLWLANTVIQYIS